MLRLVPLLLLASTGMVIPDAALALAAWWLLPDWVDRWLDIRDRWAQHVSSRR
jgi:hypothetical protein